MIDKIQTLNFNNPISPFILSIILIVFIIFYFKFSTGIKIRISKKSYLFITITQILIFIILLLSITEPVIKTVKIKKKTGTLITLFDGSGSTHQREESPWSIIYKKNNPIIKNIKNIEPKYYIFSNHIKPIFPDKIKLPKMNYNTDIIKAIDDSVKLTPNNNEKILLLFSDGRSFISENDIDTLKLQGIPIYTVGLGEQLGEHTRISDINIENLIINESLTKNTPSLIKSKIKILGKNIDQINLTLKINNKIINNKIIKIIPGKNSYLYQYQWLPENKGNFNISLHAKTFPDEYNIFNNKINKLVTVFEKNKKVLFVINRLNWEYSFLYNFMTSYYDNRIDKIIVAGKNKIITNNEKYQLGFPDPKSLLDYEAIILAGISPDTFNPKQLKNLENYISQHGRNVFFLLAENFFANKNKTPIELRKILPIMLDNQPIFYTKKKKLNWILDTNFFSSKLKKQLQDINTYNYTLPIITNKKETANTICQINHQNDSAYIILNQRYGSGYIFYSSLTSSWLWQIDQNKKLKDLYQLFWQEIISSFLGNSFSNQKVMTLALSKDQVFINESVDLHALINDSKLLNSKFTYELNIQQENEKPFKIPWKSPFGSKNRLFSTFSPQKPGAYTINAYLKIGQQTFTDIKSLNVRENLEEFNNISLNKNNLKRISNATGGSYLSFKEYMKSPFSFNRQISYTHQTIIAPLWTSKVYYILVLLLFSILWTFRRSLNME